MTLAGKVWVQDNPWSFPDHFSRFRWGLEVFFNEILPQAASTEKSQRHLFLARCASDFKWDCSPVSVSILTFWYSISFFHHFFHVRNFWQLQSPNPWVPHNLSSCTASVFSWPINIRASSMKQRGLYGVGQFRFPITIFFTAKTPSESRPVWNMDGKCSLKLITVWPTASNSGK